MIFSLGVKPYPFFVKAVDPNIKEQVEKIIEAQKILYSLQYDLELEIGVKIVVDLEHFNCIAMGFAKSLDEIKEAYEYLIFSKVAESRGCCANLVH